MLLVLMLSGFGLVRQASGQSENLKVLSYSWYIDSIGGFDVVGEVQNLGSTVLNPVVLSGTVFTPDGVAQAQSNPSVVYVNYMLPQQKAPFLMEFRSGDLSWLSQGVDHVEFGVVRANATSSYQYPNLTVTSGKLSTDSEGVSWVSGTVQNTGGKTATNVRVIATFYNASKTVIAAGYTDPLTPTSLNPSGYASFKVGAFDLNKTLEITPNREIASYTLLVQTAGPLLSGTPPPVSSSDSSSTPAESPTDSSSNSGSSSPETPYMRYVAIVVIVVILIGGALLVFKRRKSSKATTEKNTKSQTVSRRKQSPKGGLRSV